ncbi:MAG: hypothetical protein ACKO3R_10285, partial [bacterium]
SSDAEDATPVSYASKRKYKLRLISSDAEDATPVSYASKRKYKLRLLGVHEDHEDDENAEIGVSLHAHIRLLSYISIFSYLIPVIIFLSCKSNKLLSGWLSVSHFITAILLYVLFHKFTRIRFYKLSYRIAFTSIIVLFLIKYLWIFHPSIFSKVNTININYTAVINKLEKLNLKDKEIICDNQMVYANLKILKPEWNLSYFKNKQERAKIKKEIPDLIKQEIKAPYLHNKSHQNKNTIILFFLHNTILKNSLESQAVRD